MRRCRLVVLSVMLVAALGLVPGAVAHGGHSQTVDGTLRAWHGDTWSDPVGVGLGVDTGIAGVVRLAGSTTGAGGLLGRHVHAQGALRGSTLALTGRLAVTNASARAAAVAATGSKSVAVLLFNFSNDTRQPWTTDAVRSVMFDSADSVRAYYLDASYGALSVSGSVFGWYTIDATNAGCAYSTWASQARAKATAAGVPLSSYQYVVYAFPQASSCGWSGLAYMPGSGAWINGSMTLRVVGHELGHNFGVHHASTLACSSGSLAGTCTASEYGDPFTVMGSSSRRLHNNWQRAQLGWLGGIVTATSGIYTLAPAEVSTSAARLVRIPRGDGTYLNLEFRQPSGRFDDFAASDAAVNGVSVRIAPDIGSVVQSKLIDATPGSSGGFNDAALGPGGTLTDPLSGIKVTVVSVSPAGATVSIQPAGGSDTQAPGAPGALTATAQGSSAVALSWGAATDNVGVTGYRVYRDGSLVTTTTSRSFTDTGLAPATTYAYEVKAVDAAGNTSAAATASATTSAASADTTLPTAPANLTVTRGKALRASLTWSAATDNVGVTAYRVYRNGTQVGQVATLAFQEKPGRGSFTYTVRALDAAGNLGPASNAATIHL